RGARAIFSWASYLREGLDAYFDARVAKTETEQYFDKASKYWKQIETVVDSDGEFKCPADVFSVSVMSKIAYRYPVMTFRTKIPSMVEEQDIEIGFSTQSVTGVGKAIFGFSSKGMGVTVSSGYKVINKDLKAASPADRETVRHRYTIKVNVNNVEFFIDNELVCVAILMPSPKIFAFEYPPYAIFNVYNPFASELNAWIEVEGHLKGELVFPLAPSQINFSGGAPRPPRVYRLYKENSTDLLAGLDVDPDVTSHPVPVFGYEGKTLLFQADGAGTLEIQVLTQAGNWRTYDSISVSANSLEAYPMTGDAALMRVYFAPDSPPAKITDAEVVLR
ncbi:MAG: hypothetical protein DRN91_09170, partial [Candidatus Alkanophagales archaeon]